MDRAVTNFATPHRTGFTLIEAALATVIIGVGVVAMLQLLAAGSMANREGTFSTTALNLARNVHELAVPLAYSDPNGTQTGETGPSTYDNLYDLHNKTFSPPIDATGKTISELSNWSQTVTVQNLDPRRLTTPQSLGSTRAMQITVTVSQNGQAVYSTNWLAFDTQP